MFRQTLIAAALLSTGAAHAALNTGDIAFTSFNADEDGWAIVSFVDIAPNTTLYFSDNEWNGSAWTDSNEHALTWNSGASTIAAGTVVTFLEIDGSPDVISASAGTLALAAGAGSNLGLAKSNETFYAYVGSSAAAPSSFLTAVTTEFDSSPANVTNAGLSFGVNALALSNDADFGEYVGARSGETSLDAYRALVFNNANWNMAGSGEFTGRALDATAFTAVVPEPEQYALLLAGLGLVGAATRRRQQH